MLLRTKQGAFLGPFTFADFKLRTVGSHQKEEFQRILSSLINFFHSFLETSAILLFSKIIVETQYVQIRK